MAMKANKEVGLAKRIAWAIEVIKTDKSLDKGIQDIELAKILGTNKNTLAAYRNEKGLIKGEFIERLISRYNFDPAWIFKGIGEPFPGAGRTYPEMCGPESQSDRSGAASTTFLPLGGAMQAEGREEKVSDLLHKTAIILESKTILNRLFRSNIELFHSLVLAEDKTEPLHKVTGGQNALIAGQDKKLLDQDKKLLDLERKINYLTTKEEGQIAGKSAKKEPIGRKDSKAGIDHRVKK